MIEIKPVDLPGGRRVWVLHIDFSENGLDIINESFKTSREALDFAREWMDTEVHF